MNLPKMDTKQQGNGNYVKQNIVTTQFQSGSLLGKRHNGKLTVYIPVELKMYMMGACCDNVE